MALVVLLAIVMFSGALLLLAGRAILFARNEEHLRSSLLVIDVVAFHNLVSIDEDVFLRSALPGRCYRKAKRLRTRAVQQYLRSVAHNCAVLQLLLRFAPHEVERIDVQLRSLAAFSLRLRIASLGLWAALWIQWVFPFVDLQPGSLIHNYEDFMGRVRGFSASSTAGRKFLPEHS